jgi:hypothetical protein
MIYTENTIERFNEYAYDKLFEHVKQIKYFSGLNGCGLTITPPESEPIEVVTIWYDEENNIVYADTESGEYMLSDFEMEDYLNALEFFGL